MAEKIFIGVAWPYANGPLHLGHVAGCYLPADIFARYHRAKGNEVLMVSGSDQHGTPITIRAENEGVTPKQVVEKYHAEFLESWVRLGITFDLFTTTGTANHAAVVHDIFKDLVDKGHIMTDKMAMPYCVKERRFLPDRYVEGVCPYCQQPGARGDQCDACGKPLNPQELLQLKCRLCGTEPEIRESEHFFLRLGDFEGDLLKWLEEKDHWRTSVLNFTRQYIQDGLRARAITRDIEWGVTVPYENYDQKRIYVWFEAVIGYLSASKEWAQKQGKPEAWRPFWESADAKSYYFMGKDNVLFHAIIWPAMLMGYGGLNLPYDVPANEFLTLESNKISTSRNWAVWLPDYLDRYQPDSLRYYLAVNMPETGDSDFSWRSFVRRNNDELVATYGNLVNRVLTFTYRSFDGNVPDPGELKSPSKIILGKAEQAVKDADQLLGRRRFKESIWVGLTLAQEANRYIDAEAPWSTLRDAPDRCAQTLWTGIAVINALKTIFYPFLPFSSKHLHGLLGLPGDIEEGPWEFKPVQAGQKLQPPSPLFAKLDESIVEVEVDRLGETDK